MLWSINCAVVTGTWKCLLLSLCTDHQHSLESQSLTNWLLCPQRQWASMLPRTRTALFEDRFWLLTFPYGSKAWWPLASNILRLFWGNHSESSLLSIKCYSVELLEKNSITKNCGKNSHYHNRKPTFHMWQLHRIVVIGIHARKLVLFHGVENGRSDCVTHWCLSQRVGI